MDLEGEQSNGSRNGPGFVAAVCVRDVWEDLSIDEKDWCVDVITAEILRHSEAWHSAERTDLSSMSADRPCAVVVSQLLDKPLAPSKINRVRDAFAAAITHPINDVRRHATSGVDEHFWPANRDLAMRSINALATNAQLIEQASRDRKGAAVRSATRLC